MISRHRFSVTQMTAKCELKCVCVTLSLPWPLSRYVIAAMLVDENKRSLIGCILVVHQELYIAPLLSVPPQIGLQTTYSGLAASLKRKVKYTTYHASYIVNFVPCQTNKGRVLGILGHFCVPRNGPLEILFDHSDMRPRYNHADRLQIAI